MKLERSSTSAAKQYWERIDRTAQKADTWPAWKKTDWVARDQQVESKDQQPKRSTKQEQE
jgi:hypothetical protein